ncbi:Leucine rich repeat [Teratosphaeria destructans]|uniref:Leucine rich repeat n=1 Tax=Teratosphaeria destructans TaxID=418781 RepID=A0A9W7VZQ5_9PEZI|nr:Leucine rich repeat [Teratosphaeria destructans]
MRTDSVTQNLAYFVRTHEKALANALQLQRTKSGHQQSSTAASSSTTVSLAEALTRPYVGFSSRDLRRTQLALTPHHLFYLLSKFEELGVDIGPMNIRLENLNSDAPSNYMSFLGHAPKSRGKQADTESLRSISSVRSVMSSVSSIWSNFSLSSSAAKEEKRRAQNREDIRYLYSCFTKMPSLKLSPDHRARLVKGYEEFPFDTAVPLFAFKNLHELEICDLDFRQFNGWDRMADQLWFLTVRRAALDDPIDLLRNIVLDDLERRRKRSSKTQGPLTPSTLGAPWPSYSSSPKGRQCDLARSYTLPASPVIDQRRASLGHPYIVRAGSSDGTKSPAKAHARQRSPSPSRPSTSRHGSSHKSRRSGVPVNRRSSGSSSSSTHDVTPRQSTSDLLAMNILPPSKWRFLRHLSLAENGLTSLTTEGLRPVAATLQSLDLSGNLFTEIPDALASLTHLRALNMSNCMINSLQSLTKYPLPAITTLNLRSNRLLSLIGIESIRTLERVDLRDNKLYDPSELRRLTNALDLVDVYVIKNPFIRTHSNYRTAIFNAFRDVPGHTHDIAIDTLGPTYNEKKLLHDRAPEPVQAPVIAPPPEDVDWSEATSGAAEPVPELDSVDSDEESQGQPSQVAAHRRATSDVGLKSVSKRKKGTRRRIVELSKRETASGAPKDPPLQHTAEIPLPTPSDPEEPTTPEPTQYHTVPATQIQPQSRQQLSERPRLSTNFTSPTPSPRIRDPSDDENSPLQSPSTIHPVDSHTELYRQKIEALKRDMGPNWLAALNEDRHEDGRARTTRATNVRPEMPVKAIGTGGRTLG